MKVIVFMIILFSIACNESGKDIKQVISYGQIHAANKVSVELQLDNYSHFTDLEKRASTLACGDSIAYLSTDKKNLTKEIYLSNHCIYTISCYNLRNILLIHNDSIDRGTTFPLDSLSTFMRRHYSNTSNNPSFAEDPTKFGIAISYTTDNFINIPIILDSITEVYDRIDPDVPLSIFLDQKIEPPSPPG